MQIFHNANYDFIRWRWHALVLSSAVIIGGFVLMLAVKPRKAFRPACRT